MTRVFRKVDEAEEVDVVDVKEEEVVEAQLVESDELELRVEVVDESRKQRLVLQLCSRLI